MKEILYILLDNYAEHEIGFMPGAVSADYAALVLIGGFGWMNPEAERVLPIVKDALSKGVVVIIGDGSR